MSMNQPWGRAPICQINVGREKGGGGTGMFPCSHSFTTLVGFSCHVLSGVHNYYIKDTRPIEFYCAGAQIYSTGQMYVFTPSPAL